MGPLTNLIVNRGFDRFHGGLKAQCRACGIGYQLIYCAPTPNTAMRLEFETPLHLAAIYVWESGLCDLVIYEVDNENHVLWEHSEPQCEDEFLKVIPRAVLFMRYALEGKNPWDAID